jgi:hypothetical protein
MWKKLASKILLDHPRLKVLEDEVELPNGHTTQYLKIDSRVIINDPCNLSFVIQNTRKAVGRVAFGGYFFVPIVIGICGIL